MQRYFGQPATSLTRHFVREFFYLRFLTDAGADGVRRTVMALVAGMISLFIFFPQLVVARYAALSARATPEPYRLALLGGQLFTLAVSMFIAALVAALVCQSIFPDDTDYRVLAPLPLSRRLIFGTKVLALLMFSSIFIASNILAFGAGFAVASGGRWAEPSLTLSIAAHSIVVGLASVGAGAAVVAVQGAVTLVSPRGWRRSASALSQSAMVGALILSLPLILRTAGDPRFVQSRRSLLFFAPPAWFLGLEQLLLGSRETYFARLAAMAVVGSLTAIAVIVASYLRLYRDFDQLTSQSARMAPRGLRRSDRIRPRRGRLCIDPVRSAVAAFTGATLRRSGAHQFVFTSIVACGLALAANRLLGAPSLAWVDTNRLATTGMIAIISTPLVLLLFAIGAVRQTLLLPHELYANWVFRLAESDRLRLQQMHSVERTFVSLGLVPCLVLTFPFHAIVLGIVKAAAALMLNTLAGLLLVEIVIRKWRRIPFTCAYIPAKRHLVHTLLLAFTAYTVFVNVGAVLIIASLKSRTFLIVLSGLLLAVIAGARRHRLATGASAPIEFEDDPDEHVQLMHLFRQ